MIAAADAAARPCRMNEERSNARRIALAGRAANPRLAAVVAAVVRTLRRLQSAAADDSAFVLGDEIRCRRE